MSRLVKWGLGWRSRLGILERVYGIRVEACEVGSQWEFAARPLGEQWRFDFGDSGGDTQKVWKGWRSDCV